jgi:lipoate---protein ligase
VCDEPCFRVWTYLSPAIVLGCSQRGLCNAVAQRLRGRAELVLRESGGGAVLVGPWLVGVSVVLPLTHPWARDGVMGSYQRLGQLHATVLDGCGVVARAIPPDELCGIRAVSPAASVEWACFGSLSPWELVNTQGRKLVGMAQRKKQSGVLLVAGTLLGEVDWRFLCEAMGKPHDESTLRGRTVSAQEMGEQQIEPQRYASALEHAIQHAI